MKKRLRSIRVWLTRHWQRLALYGGIGLFVLLMAVQFTYPSHRMPLFLSIDDVVVGAMRDEAAVAALDEAYDELEVGLYFGDATKPYRTVKPSDIGVAVAHESRVADIDYSWWLRLIPSSLVWAHLVVDTGEPAYIHDEAVVRDYITNDFGESCYIQPRSATAEVADDVVKLVPAQDGGSCETEAVTKQLLAVKPRLGEDNDVRFALETVPPAVLDDEVAPIVEVLNQRLQRDIAVQVNDTTVTLAASAVRGWLIFTVDDEAGFSVSLDATRANDTLQEQLASHVTTPAGVTKVTTHDFTETARSDGAVGSQLDVATTLAHITAYVLGENDTVAVAVAAVQPRVEYTRTYSTTDAGLSALIKNYAESTPGVYGVSLIELSGQRRRAAYNDTRQFTTASTYKLYVAYSTLRRVEDGTFKWSDVITGGRTLETCFNDMIVLSDNPCAEALVQKIGYRALTNEAVAIGAVRTTFVDLESYKTTAGDLSTTMALLESGQLPINAESRERLLSALRRNVYRQGIPSGASGTVADKVGFLEGLLHDTAIVYSPNGTYVLTILTDGSSWANIAELTRQIEALRGQ